MVPQVLSCSESSDSDGKFRRLPVTHWQARGQAEESYSCPQAQTVLAESQV
jgi:hypothetical protein